MIGAVAANRYRREVRLTGDLDILVASHASGLDSFERALQAGGWSVRRGTPDGAILRLRHAEHGAVDVVLAETEYQHEAIRRAIPEHDLAIRVLTAEDVIVHKLIAGRPRDVADIDDILAAGVALDAAYLERWATYWDVIDLWRRLRSQRG